MKKIIFLLGICACAAALNACNDEHEVRQYVNCCSYYCANGADAMSNYQFPKADSTLYICEDVSLCDCSKDKAVCGNQIIDAGETCDGLNFGGKTCADLIPGTTGTLTCQTNCLGIDTSLCKPVSPVCGNTVIEGSEVCDGQNLGGKTCGDLIQGSTGVLGCKAGCLEFDTTNCEVAGDAVCGNTVIEGSEVCDGQNLGGKTCGDVIQGSTGVLGCKAGCLEFDTTNCEVAGDAVCGNTVIEGSEVCDGQNLGGKTCGDVIQGSTGVLGCKAGCLEFDTSLCTDSLCGNGVLDDGEVCDDKVMGGHNCAEFGAGYTGVLKCKDNCREFDASSCVAPVLPNCGNGVLDDGELCDGDQYRAEYTCKSIFGPGSEGTLSCAENCLHYVTSDCTPAMNVSNGTIEINERCDTGYNDGESDCSEYYGEFVTGKRSCNKMGRFDISACMPSDHCGNGIVEPEYGEDCDPAVMESYAKTCEDFRGSGSVGQVTCDRLCKLSADLCTTSSACGNNVADNGTNGRPNYSEVCDPGDLKKKTCAHLGTGYHGELGCLINCSGFDYSNCELPGI